MNNEEAKIHLQSARLMLLDADGQPVSDLYYAVEKGIEALETIPKYKDAYNKGFEDCRQAVLDALYKLCNTGETLIENPWRDNPHIDALIDAIEELSPVNPQEPKWIPVSERLPEKNMPCLVSAGKLCLTQIAIYSDLMGTIDHRIFYQGDYGYENFVDITQYVIAWMPLPEPYKAESEDKE